MLHAESQSSLRAQLRPMGFRSKGGFPFTARLNRLRGSAGALTGSRHHVPLAGLPPSFLRTTCFDFLFLSLFCPILVFHLYGFSLLDFSFTEMAGPLMRKTQPPLTELTLAFPPNARARSKLSSRLNKRQIPSANFRPAATTTFLRLRPCARLKIHCLT